MDEAGRLEGVERRVFVASAGALVGDDAGDWIADAASPFIARLTPADRKLLSGLLRALQYAGPLFVARLRGFSGMPRDDRERLFERWNGGPLQTRQAVSSLRALATLAYYGSPHGWSHAGYDGPWLGRVDVPVLPPPRIREQGEDVEVRASSQVLHGRRIDGDIRTRAEVCVIGAGAGGASAAARLAAEGVDVLIVEAGGFPGADEFTQRELEMLPLLYQDGGLRATADKSIGILQGRGVGGSTLHNTGLVYEAPPGILERWRRDHAFAHDDVAWAKQVIAVTRKLGARPIPPDRINRSNALLARGASALGWRHSVARHNRIESSGCGYCMLGCAYNRKQNASLTWIPSALEDGARILTDARVLSITGPSDARRVTCVLTDAAGRSTGRRAEIDARVVVVAAGAIDTPALLRRSGLGGDRVGRGLRLHPAPLVYAEFEEPVIAWRGIGQSVLIEEFASFEDDGRGGYMLLASGGVQPVLAAVGAPGIGRRHHELMGRYPNIAAAAVLLHDETAGRVTVSKEGRPVIRYWPDAADTREMLAGIRALANLWFAAGAKRVWLPFGAVPPVEHPGALDDAMLRARVRPHRMLLNAVHPQGTCAMGGSRSSSVVNPQGALWDEPGIIVADASLFPTSVGVPPQVTIMALASATAAHLAAERF